MEGPFNSGASPVPRPPTDCAHVWTEKLHKAGLSFIVSNFELHQIKDRRGLPARRTGDRLAPNLYNDRDNRPGTPPPLLALSCQSSSSSSSVAYSGGVFAKLRGPNLPSPPPSQGHARPSSPFVLRVLPAWNAIRPIQGGTGTSPYAPPPGPMPPGSEYPPAAAADWAPPPYVKEADGEAAKYPPSPGPPPAAHISVRPSYTGCSRTPPSPPPRSLPPHPRSPPPDVFSVGLHHFHLPNPQADDPLFVDYSRTRMHSRAKMDGGTTTPQPTPTPSRCIPTSAPGVISLGTRGTPPPGCKDVSAADVGRRSSASHLGDINVETDQERRAKHKACKEIPRPAAALVETPGTPTELEGFFGSREQAHRGYGRVAGRRGVGVGRRIRLWEKSPPSACPIPSPKSRSPNTGRNPSPAPLRRRSPRRRPASRHSRTACATRACIADSPLADETECGAFTSGGAEEDFDGTRGVFDSTIGVKAEPEVVRGLPSPGLVRGAGGVPARCWRRLGEGDRWVSSQLFPARGADGGRGGKVRGREVMAIYSGYSGALSVGDSDSLLDLWKA
ncbi:hypothetical protein B0H14DRAFT_2641355 [Mycena olivaceomarginata]|nr:hypothetical protein B0H14DRAFT_2641355 [Mycena olivaceomarginata]